MLEAALSLTDSTKSFSTVHSTAAGKKKENVAFNIRFRRRCTGNMCEARVDDERRGGGRGIGWWSLGQA